MVMENVTKELARLRFQQKIYADKVSSPFKPLELNEKVRLQKGHRDWVSARVVDHTPNPRSVIVETSNGNRYRRNTIHLQRTSANIPDAPQIETNFGTEESTREEVQPDMQNRSFANADVSVSNEDMVATNIPPAKKRPGRPPGKQIKSSPSSDLPKVTKSGRAVKQPDRYVP